MNAKEKIKKLQQQLDNLKAELDKPEFEVGDWVIATAIGGNDSLHDWYDLENAIVIEGDIDRVCDVDGSVLKVFGTAYRAGYVRKATPTEIETALRKEAERRGFKKGVYIDNTELGWDVDGYKINGEYWWYDELNDRLSLESYFIYDNGKWAEIVKDKVKFFDWDVEHKGDIKIGCRWYERSYLKELKSDMQRLNDEGLGYKDIHDLVIQLEKLDLD